MENISWPNWLSDTLPEWLEKTNYPAPGVGDLNDLRFTTSIGENGKWVGFVNSGWFYHNFTEQYHYVLPGSSVVAASAGSGVITQSVSFRPSWGPILLSSSTWGPYIQHANSFSPGNVTTWTSVGNLYYCTIPSSCLVAGVRDLTNLPLGSVSATGALISSKLYYYDNTLSRLYIKPKDSNIQVYLDLLYTYPVLKMRELCVQKDSQVTASYKSPCGLVDVTLIRGTQSYTFTGLSTGNTFTVPLTGTVDGDWIVLEYYISHSYILKDHNILQYYTTKATGDTFSVTWESSIPDLNRNISLSDNSTGLFNLNPLFPDAYRVGYLFHGNPASSLSSYWSPSKLRLHLSKEQVLGDIGETISLKCLLLGDNDLPIPNYPLTVSYTNTASVLARHPSTNITDGRGEIHFLFQPSSGSSTFAVTGSVGSLNQVATALVTSIANLVTKDIFEKGLINIVITDQIDGEGYYTSYTNLTTLDGIPTSTGSGNITILSELASEFSYVDQSGSQRRATTQFSINTSKDLDNVYAKSKFGYSPQPTDYVMGVCDTAQSILLDGDD